MFNIKTTIKMKCKMMFAALALLSAIHVHAQEQILGEWMSPKKDSRILIYQKQGKFEGKITWGQGGSALDVNNPDPTLRTREVIGLAILRNFVYDGDDKSWIDGTIYDPREGKTYSCRMSMKDNSTLVIRGYVGISLFGRNEIWTRYQPKN